MKWTIGAKIASGFGLALLVLLLIGGISHRSTVKLVEAAAWVGHTQNVLRKLEHVVSTVKDVETGQRGYLLTNQLRFLEPYTGARERVQHSLRELRRLTRDNAGQQRRLDAFEAAVATKFDETEQILAIHRTQGAQAAIARVLEDRGRRSMEEVREIAAAMQEEEARLLAERDAEANQRARETELTIVWGILLSLVLLGAVAALVTLNIARPLGSVSAAAQSIAEGDFSVSLPREPRADEVGRLVQSFDHMAQRLGEMGRVAERIAAGDLSVSITPQSERDALGKAFATMRDGLRRSTTELREAASVLAASSSEILAASTQVAAGAAQTATAVTETTTTVEEVKQTAQVSSQKARLVSDGAVRAAATAQDGRRAMEETIDGLQRIQEQMGSIAEMVVKLSEQSQAIGDIVSTVTDLADQTNLLAVNAAIEAARAGEQGKGFAVVAQEVKSLADQSKQATGQVRKILNEIQKAISGAVMATEQGSKSVDAGVLQSQEASDAIRSLAETIEGNAQAALQIAASSQQQSIGMDQVAAAMESIKQASLQNVGGTKQTEVAARTLHDVGFKLKELMERYRT